MPCHLQNCAGDVADDVDSDMDTNLDADVAPFLKGSPICLPEGSNCIYL